MRRDLKGPAPAPAFGGRRRSTPGRGGASPGAIAERAGRHRGGVARTATLALACGLLAMLLLAGNAAAAAPTFDSSFECSVATPCGSFTSWTPTYVAVSQRTGDVYVTDAANDAIEVFDSSGNYVSQILGRSTTNGTFGFANGNPDDIAVDNSGGATDGRIYAESNGQGFVFAFDASGNFLWQSNAGIGYAGGVAVDPSGHPWVSDILNGIQELNPTDGSAVGSPLLPGGFYANLAFESNGDFVAVVFGGGAHVFDSTGRELHADDSGLDNTDVAVETLTNSVYSVDRQGVTIWDSSGNVIPGTPFGTAGAFNSVDVNPSNSKIYITEPSTGRVDIYDFQLFTLDVTANGSGSGRVDSDTGRISGCTSSGGTCSDQYFSGSTVTLAASPDAGSNFTGWSGCDNPSGNTCVESLTSARSVTATFDPIPRHVLRVVEAGTGAGLVASSDRQISCTGTGSTCEASYTEGDLVGLTARASAGSTFTGWSGGGCSGTGPCQITVNADTTVTATFTQSPPTVSTGSASGVTQSAATLSGTVNPNGAATSCTFEYGTATSYGSSVPCASAPGSGTSGVAASAALSGLAAGTTYHYRIVASNPGGTSNGADATFTTAAPPQRTCQTDSSLCPRTRPGVLHLAKAVVTMSSGKVVVKLSCVGDTTCHGTLKVTTKVKTTTGKGRSRRTRTVTVIVAEGSVRLTAGHSGRVTLKLTSTGRRLLARTHLLRTTLAGVGLRHTLVIRSKVVKKGH